MYLAESLCILSRNYDNEAAVHRSMQVIWVYLSGAAGTLHQSDNFITSTTFKKRIGQYLLQEINIKVQNEEISMI